MRRHPLAVLFGCEELIDTAARSRGAYSTRALWQPASHLREGAGKAGHRLMPMVRVQKKSTRQNHRFSRNTRPSLRNGFNGLLRALPGDRALLPPSSVRRLKRHCELSASVGAPGPHGLAVRARVSRLLPHPRPPHPASTFVTTRTPLSMRRDDRFINLILADREAIYFSPGGWTRIRGRCPSGKSLSQINAKNPLFDCVKHTAVIPGRASTPALNLISRQHGRWAPRPQPFGPTCARQ
jgi:hypothetical protein